MNVRLYNAKKDPKIINYTEGRYKYGSPARLYGIDELVKYQGKQVVLCEGELETVKRMVRLLKRFNLLDTTRDGYVKKPKFNKFLRRFLKAHPEFFADAAWGGGQPQNGDNSLDFKGVSESGGEG